jgi:hypothetical protein
MLPRLGKRVPRHALRTRTAPTEPLSRRAPACRRVPPPLFPPLYRGEASPFHERSSWLLKVAHNPTRRPRRRRPPSTPPPSRSSYLPTLPPPTKCPNCSTQPHTVFLCRLLHCWCRPLRWSGAPAAAEQPRHRACSLVTSPPRLRPQTDRW